MQVIHEKTSVNLIGRGHDGEKGMVSVSTKQVLRSVTTVKEVSECWGKSIRTVQRAIDKGKLIAEQSGATWLIITQSVVKVWGQPICKFGEKRDE